MNRQGKVVDGLGLGARFCGYGHRGKNLALKKKGKKKITAPRWGRGLYFFFL
jgi:hypothetical protein